MKSSKVISQLSTPWYTCALKHLINWTWKPWLSISVLSIPMTTERFSQSSNQVQKLPEATVLVKKHFASNSIWWHSPSIVRQQSFWFSEQNFTDIWDCTLKHLWICVQKTSAKFYQNNPSFKGRMDYSGEPWLIHHFRTGDRVLHSLQLQKSHYRPHKMFTCPN